MVTKYVNQPLGLGNSLAPTQKQWIGAVLGAVGGLASSIFGGSAAAAAQARAEKRQREQEAQERAWYERRYNEDYVDTAAGRNLVRRAKDFARENWKKAAGAKAVGGGTDAATAQAKEAGNKMMGDTIANIAATDLARKSRVDDQHRQAQERSAQMDINRELTRAQNITNATSQASNALMSIGSAVDQAGLGKTNLTGGNNGGQQVNTQAIDSGMGEFGKPDPTGNADWDELRRVMGG